VELTATEEKPQPLARREQPIATLDPQALLKSAVEHGAGIETLERLVALAAEVRAQAAKDAWLDAMAKFQRDCPAIRKTKNAKIQTRGGGWYSYAYAPLDEVMRVILPILGPLGLSVSYRVRHEPDRVMASCRISHDMGHAEESGEVAMPIVQGDGTGATPAQRVGIATSYAKRYALLAIIGLAPEDDLDGDDGGGSGERTGRPDENMPRAREDAAGGVCITASQKRLIYARLKAAEITDEELKQHFGLDHITDIKMSRINEVLAWIDNPSDA
jgi:hypothetical protein